MRILMVCLGNICRSPIAEGVLRHKIRQHGLNWTVESAGTESYHVGEPPHPLSRKVCSKHGIDISGLRAARFTRADFGRYDRIYAMAHDVYREIARIGGAGADMSKVDYFLNELHRQPGSSMELNDSVPDPYYGTEQGYHEVFALINKTCDAIIEHYKQQHYV